MNFCKEIYEKRWGNIELEKVSKIWKVLVEDFFQPMISYESKVLDIGCGFCHFLNHLQAKEKVGVDANPLSINYAMNDIIFYCTDDLTLPMLSNDYFDFVFISNFLEHLDSSKDVIALLKRVRELLKLGGRIIILQPNFRLLGAAYFDFIDHKTVLTDKSLNEALYVSGFEVERKIVRFLPYTTKSKLPQHPLLVKFYLQFRPLWLILGKQSLFIGVKTNKQATV